MGGVVGNGMKRSLSKLFSRKTPARGPVLLPPAGFVELGSENYVGFEARQEVEDEDEMDAEERRLVPLFDRRRVQHEGGGSAKALRMLGIS
jgi:hypothetical protein